MRTLCHSIVVLFFLTCLTSGLNGQYRPTVMPGQGGQYPNSNLMDRQQSNTAVLGQAPASNPGYHYAPTTIVQPTVVSQPSPGFGYGGMPGYGFGMGLGMPRYGPAARGIGAGYALQGYSSVIQASGQYQQDIQQARMGREQSRMMELDLQKKTLQHEWWYENQMLKSSQRSQDAQRAVALDHARKDPPRSEVESGTTLNVLLKSILASTAPDKGPYLALDPDTVRGLNLTDGSGKGSLSLAKDEGKIDWTETLEGSSFDDTRNRFEKNFQKAIKSTSYGEAPDKTTLRELKADHKAMVQALDSQVATLSPSAWIDSRKVLNKLNDTLKGLSDPKLCKSCATSGKAKIRTVSDLVTYCMKNGLEFGPAAAAGDNTAYMATYYAMRAYERDLVQAVSAAPR